MTIMDEGSHGQTEALPLSAGGDVRDFVLLMKPRVMSLVLFTALVGMVAAHGQIHPVLAFIALLCIGVGAGAAGAPQILYDADNHARLGPTGPPPLPPRRVPPPATLSFC